MRIKYLSFLLVVLSVTYIFGCNNQQASYEDTAIGGTVIDSSSKKPIAGVSVSLDMLKSSVLTDSNGFYYISNIHVPTSAGNFNITFSKPGYNTVTAFSVLYAGDTTKRLNLAMYSPTTSSVFIANDLVVSEYVNKWSNGILNLYHLFVTNDSIWYDNDAVLLDSAGSNSNFAFYAGGYAQPVSGWNTRFTNLLGYYSQYEFDTLSRINVGPRSIDPASDFPTQMTLTFNAPLTQSPVYGFYLVGRYNYAVGYPRVYGLLRIESFYFDNAANTFKAVVDVKINRNEQNYFLVN